MTGWTGEDVDDGELTKVGRIFRHKVARRIVGSRERLSLVGKGRVCAIRHWLYLLSVVYPSCTGTEFAPGICELMRALLTCLVRVVRTRVLACVPALGVECYVAGAVQPGIDVFWLLRCCTSRTHAIALGQFSTAWCFIKCRLATADGNAHAAQCTPRGRECLERRSASGLTRMGAHWARCDAHSVNGNSVVLRDSRVTPAEINPLDSRAYALRHAIRMYVDRYPCPPWPTCRDRRPDCLL